MLTPTRSGWYAPVVGNRGRRGPLTVRSAGGGRRHRQPTLSTPCFDTQGPPGAQLRPAVAVVQRTGRTPSGREWQGALVLDQGAAELVFPRHKPWGRCRPLRRRAERVQPSGDREEPPPQGLGGIRTCSPRPMDALPSGPGYGNHHLHRLISRGAGWPAQAAPTAAWFEPDAVLEAVPAAIQPAFLRFSASGRDGRPSDPCHRMCAWAQVL